MGRPRKEVAEVAEVAGPDVAYSAEAYVAEALRSDLPAMLAKAKAAGDQATIDAILRRCST